MNEQNLSGINISVPRSICWDITAKCNLKCSHCYNEKKYNHQKSELQELTKEAAFKVVDSLESYGFEYIHFLGGEPLLSPILFDVIEYAKKKRWKISINTNGTLLNENSIKEILELGVDQVAVSLDGCSATTNDKVRGLGSFYTATKSLKKLTDLKKKYKSTLQVQIVWTLTDINLVEIKELPDFIDSLEVDMLVLTTLFQCGAAEDNWERINPKLATMINGLERYVEIFTEKKRNFVTQIDYRAKIVDYLSLKYGSSEILFNPNYTKCTSGRNIWYLEADGLLHPCDVYDSIHGKQAIEDGLLLYEHVDVRNLDKLNIFELDYWKSFSKARSTLASAPAFPCDTCRYCDCCMPCPFEYNIKKTVFECEYVDQLIEDWINETKKKSIKRIKSSKVFDFKNDTAEFLWNSIDFSGVSIINIIHKLIIQFEDLHEKKIEWDVVYYFMNLRRAGLVEIF